MNMAESDGLRKLTEYLNQTKRQAENAIDILNIKINELQEQNIELSRHAEAMELERNHYKAYSEQIKSENATKWKLRERDDWKSLVDSIQSDRNRLQDECTVLEGELDRVNDENADLRDQLDKTAAALEEVRAQVQQQQENVASSSSSFSTSASNPQGVSGVESDENKENDSLSTPSKVAGRSINCEAVNNEAISPNSERIRTGIQQPTLFSPVYDRSGRPIQMPESPHAMARQLKLELKRAQNQLDIEHRLASETLSAKAIEISRLKQELEAVRPSNNMRAPGSGGGLNIQTSLVNSNSGSGNSSWGILSFIFGGSSSGSSSCSNEYNSPTGGSQILRV